MAQVQKVFVIKTRDRGLLIEDTEENPAEKTIMILMDENEAHNQLRNLVGRSTFENASPLLYNRKVYKGGREVVWVKSEDSDWKRTYTIWYEEREMVLL